MRVQLRLHTQAGVYVGVLVALILLQPWLALLLLVGINIVGVPAHWTPLAIGR